MSDRPVVLLTRKIPVAGPDRQARAVTPTEHQVIGPLAEVLYWVSTVIEEGQTITVTLEASG